MLTRALGFVHRCKDASVGGEALNSYNILDQHAYSKLVGATALGLKAGIPESAAGCDTGAVLKGYDDELAAMLSDPSLLLKPVEQWPQEPRRPFKLLDKT